MCYSEWDFNKVVVKGFIKRKLLKNSRINANECSIRQISYIIANKFLKSNCIFGELSEEFNAFGLFYNKKLVHTLCYTKIDDNLSILRNSSRIGYSIVGGFKKCLDKLKKLCSGYIFYDVDRRFSSGNLLTSYGFILESEIEPKYYYTDKNYVKLFDASVIEKECEGNENYCFYCERPKYKKIFDCGYLRFRL